ncbi:MAG: GTP 3',8-cyclase MoaA [Defluviitaleaceae bacterium]|nr:GTP 3',8-cyclase MoaA [Defluviitaleaceae bacterium]
MIDSFSRKINYMRVSITDRCNLRCAYCMPEDVESISHDDVLRFEELLHLCSIMARLGAKTIRVTGGEPLVRKGCVGFIEELKKLDGLENVTLTTNGILLSKNLDRLVAAGLDGLNISLDSQCPEIYKKITGVDAYAQVMDAIKQAVHAGMRVKVNCVPIKGVNDSQILPMAALPLTMPIDVRFIELMPTGAGGDMKGISLDEVTEIIRGAHPNLEVDDSFHGFGPARYLKSADMLGSIGFISSMSEIFCAGCNRVRLSSEGFLTLCLHHNKGLSLRELLRGGASDEEIETAILQSISEKPEKHHLLENEIGLKDMSKIGG